MRPNYAGSAAEHNVDAKSDGNRRHAPALFPRVFGKIIMLEIALLLAVAIIAATFISDAGSSTLKLARSMRRRDNIRVADTH